MKYNFLLSSTENVMGILNEISVTPVSEQDLILHGTYQPSTGSSAYYLRIQATPFSPLLVDDGVILDISYRPVFFNDALKQAGLEIMYVEDINILTDDNIVDEVYKATKIQLPANYIYKISSRGEDGVSITGYMNPFKDRITKAMGIVNNVQFTLQNVGELRVRIRSVFPSPVTYSFGTAEKIEFVNQSGDVVN